MVHNVRSEFDPHRHLRRKASVRQYNGAAAQGWSYCVLICGQNMSFLFITQGYIYWRTEQFTPHRLISK